jgi:hypothetical protein
MEMEKMSIKRFSRKRAVRVNFVITGLTLEFQIAFVEGA